MPQSTNSLATTCPQCGAPVTLPDWADLAVCPFCGSNLRRQGQPGPPGATLLGQARARLPGLPGATPLGLAGAQPPGPADGPPAGPAGALPAGPAAAEQQVLHSLSCPQCAGPLSVQTGRRILLCGHCGIRVLVSGAGGFSRWVYPQKVDKVHALGAAARWLSDYPGVSQQARDVPVTRAQLVHIPIWEHKALIAGWEFGTKLRTQYYLVTDDDRNERLDLAVGEERFEEPHLQERRFFLAGCDLAALGATRPRLSGRELLLPLAAGEVDPSSTVLDPDGSAAEVVQRGRDLALQPASGAAAPQTRMLILKESLTLLYYPLWLVDYQAEDRGYRIVVNAHDGRVNSATAPARQTRFPPSLSLRIAALAVVAALALWLGSVWHAVRVPTVFLAVIVCVAAVLLVLRSPGGGKVEYHEPFSS